MAFENWPTIQKRPEVLHLPGVIVSRAGMSDVLRYFGFEASTDIRTLR